MKAKLLGTALAAGLSVVGVAQPASSAPQSYNLSWVGDNGYSLIGMFAFDDAFLSAPPLVQETDLTMFMVEILDPGNNVVATFDLFNQDLSFNFNFESNTGVLRQALAVPATDSLFIGSLSSYALLASSNCGSTVGGTPHVALTTGQFCTDLVDSSLTSFVMTSPKAATPATAPGALALFGLGLAGIGLAARRRRISA